MVLTTEKPASNDSFLKKQAMQFDGTNDYVNVNSSLLNDLSSFTLEGWIKLTSAVSSRTSLFGQNDVIEFGLSSSGALSAWISSPYTSIAASDSLSLNEWHHVAFAGNGNSLSLYIDGIEVQTKIHNAVNSYSTSSDQFKIGAGVWSGGATDPFKGNISDVRIWNKARTESEIQADMHQRLTGQESGLVGYWLLDSIETEGETQQVLDLSSNGNNGTVNEATVVDDIDLPINPKVIQFDGENDYLEVSNFPYIKIGGDSSSTFEIWIKTNSTSRIYIFSKNTDWHYSNRYEFGLNTESQGNLRFISGANGYSGTSVSVNDGIWHHVAVVINGNSGEFYIDGNPQGTFSPASNSEKEVSLLIGTRRQDNSSTLGAYFNGQLSEFRIWNTVRTQEEIQDNMSQRLKGQESGLVAYWPLDSIKTEGETQQVLDLSSNGNNGTVNGATLV